jgi:hypothetical protein
MLQLRSPRKQSLQFASPQNGRRARLPCCKHVQGLRRMGTIEAPRCSPHAAGKDVSKPSRQLDTANFPTDQHGRTYHVGTKVCSIQVTIQQRTGESAVHCVCHCLNQNAFRVSLMHVQRGEVSQRILACGSLGRAKMLGRLLTPLDGQRGVRSIESSRGFLTITGQWKGHAVSIVTHLMGFANMDLFLRETRAVVDEPLLVIRIGTCGSLNSEVGQVHIASKGSVAILRNPDAFMPTDNGTSEPPYRIAALQILL